jgi:hypothetical protein
MQQFRGKFLLLSDYLHNLFGAQTGDGVTTNEDVCGSCFISIFFAASVRNVRKWTRGALRHDGHREL